MITLPLDNLGKNTQSSNENNSTQDKNYLEEIKNLKEMNRTLQKRCNELKLKLREQSLSENQYYWSIFIQMHLRLHNQLDSKATRGSTTEDFLLEIDKLKNYLRGGDKKND